MTTPGWEVRLPVPEDRDRFRELFADEWYMQFSNGRLYGEDADKQFAKMLTLAADLPFAEQPVIETDTGLIVGSVGATRFNYGDPPRPELEFNYRLICQARGRGYATAASLAVLEVWENTVGGVIFARIDYRNTDSKKVADRLRFKYMEHRDLFEIYKLEVPSR